MTKKQLYITVVFFLISFLIISLVTGYILRLQRRSAPRTVRVALFDYPGRQTIDPTTGKPSGFFVDFLEDVARRQNLDLEYVVVRRVEGVSRFNWVDSCHMSMPISITEDRKQYVDFTWPCDYIDIVPVRRAVDDETTDPLAMAHARVGVMIASIQADTAREWYDKGAIGEIVIFTNAPMQFTALMNGDVDIIVEEMNTAQYFSRLYPGAFTISDDPAYTTKKFGAFPVRKGEEWLLERLNTGVRHAMADGSYLRIYRAHFGSDKGETTDIKDMPIDTLRKRLPRVEIDSIHNARAILDTYFDLISLQYSAGHTQKQIAQMDMSTQNIQKELDTTLHRAHTRLRELLLLIESRPAYMPYAAAFYFRQIDDLRRGLRTLVDTLENIHRDKEQEHIVTKNNVRMIYALDIPYPELQWRREWIEFNLRPLIEARERNLMHLDTMIARSIELLDDVETAAADTELSIIDNYTRYIFHRFTFWGHTHDRGVIAQWRAFYHALKEWIVVLPTYMKAAMPTMHRWPLLTQLLSLFALIGVGATLLIKRRTHTVAHFARPLLLALLGAYFVSVYHFLPGSEQDMVYNIAALLLALAAIDGAGKLSNRAGIHVPVIPLVFSLLSVFVIDVMTGLLAPLSVLLAALILLGCANLLVGVFIYASLPRTPNPHANKTLRILHATSLVWVAATVSALLSYLYLAMLFAVCGVLIVTVVWVSVAFSRFFAVTAESLARKRRVVASFISSLVIPFVWLVMFYGATHWTAEIFNADRVVLHLYTRDLLPSMPFKITPQLLLYLGVIGLLVKFILDWLNDIMTSISTGRHLDAGTVNTTLLAVKYLVWMGYTVYALSLLSFDWNNMKWVVGGLSVGFGFAFKDVIENFFCGLIVLLGREVRPGDIIQYDDICGTVEKINVRATFVKTFDNAIVSIPNSDVVAKDFKNWTLNGKIRRSECDVGVAYGSDVPLVIESLIEAAKACTHILTFIEPQVLFASFSDNSLIFRLRFWIHVDNWTAAPSELRQQINDVFRRKGITIAFPQLDVHLVNSEQ